MVTRRSFLKIGCTAGALGVVGRFTRFGMMTAMADDRNCCLVQLYRNAGHRSRAFDWRETLEDRKDRASVCNANPKFR